MALTPIRPGRLRVFQACREGWSAFGLAPGPFLIFSILSSLAMGASALLMGLGVSALVLVPEATGMEAAFLPRLIVMLISLGALLVGLLLLGVVTLVTALGLCRGAWLALGGHKPRFADLIRWDGAAINRLILAWTAWQLLLLVGLVPLGLVGWGLRSLGLGPVVWWPIGLVALLLYGWISLTQTFLNPLCLLGNAKPLVTVRCGIQAVHGNWWRVCGLNGLLLALIVVSSGASANAAGIVLAPLVGCINLAAYRQLFGADDRLGLIKPSPEQPL
jgi:hypothetical protein